MNKEMIDVLNKFQNVDIQKSKYLQWAIQLSIESVDKFSDNEFAEELLEWLLLNYHECIVKDAESFVKDFLLDSSVFIRKLVNEKYIIYEQLNSLLENKDRLVEFRSEVVELYRKFISDLVDPYLTFAIAPFFFLSEDYVSLDSLNIRFGEFNKYEYLVSKSPKVFGSIGYNSIIRNAVSHRGTEGVRFVEGRVIFKSIKRGATPRVETLTILVEEVLDMITRMMNFIHAIDLSLRILQIESMEIIEGNDELLNKLLITAIPLEQRIMIQEANDVKVEKISLSKELSVEEKVSELREIAFERMFKLRNDCLDISYEVHAMPLIVARIKAKPFDHDSSEEIIDRIFQINRYGLVVAPVFKNIVTHFVVVEITDDGQEEMSMIGAVDVYMKYQREELPFYEVINQTKFLFRDRPITVIMDRESLEEVFYTKWNQRPDRY